MKKILVLGLAFSAMSVGSASLHAATEADIDRMTSYSLILGRAIGCGIDVELEIRQVGSWMDSVFPPGSADQQTFLPIFGAGLIYHAEMQSNGDSPDSCNTVQREFSKMVWP